MTLRSLFLVLIGLGIAFFQPVAAEPPGTVVKHVNYAKKTVTLELYRREQGTREVQVYKIDMGCTITLDGQTVKLEKIHRGQHVIGITEGDVGILDVLNCQS